VDGLALKLKPMPTAVHTQALYAVYGASGCGRSVMPLAREQLVRAGMSANQLVFVDDQPGPPEVNGQRLLSYTQFLAEPAAERYAVLAIASGKVREALAKRLSADGVQPWSVAAANVVQMDAVHLGVGAVLSPFVTITSNVRIGQHFHANLYSYVEHDCVVGDFVTFAPGVHCNGNVVIEDHAYIGTGAILKQGQPGKPLVIGRGAVVGMGAVVTKSVAPGVTVVGNPARPMQKA
jgi:sugar O-acyltransferase (sialic acid O-acetyltransferase NeuD family)